MKSRIERGTLVLVLGTSTVEMFLTDYEEIDGQDLRSLCGVAEDSIIPGFLGGETGQAAFGDLFSWFGGILCSYEGLMADRLADERSEDAGFGARGNARIPELLGHLDELAALRGPSEVVALDWLNGRRYPKPNDAVGAAVACLRIGNDAVDIYRAIVESAVLGSMLLVRLLGEKGISFARAVLVGGIARRSEFVSQLVTDALGIETMVSPENQVCARGAAVYAAVAGGFFSRIEEAQSRMCKTFEADHWPRRTETEHLESALVRYRRLGTAVEEATRRPNG